MRRTTALPLLSALLLAPLLALPAAARPDFEAHPHGEVLRKLDAFTGDWAGTFRSFEPDGTVATTIEVRQTYRWERDVQVGEFRETMPDGSVVTAQARNFVKEDGTLVCEVDKSTGDSTVHVGTITDAGEIVWHRRADGVTEAFREEVFEKDGRTVYAINGIGVYGEAAFLFHGAYFRQ